MKLSGLVVVPTCWVPMLSQLERPCLWATLWPGNWRSLFKCRQWTLFFCHCSVLMDLFLGMWSYACFRVQMRVCLCVCALHTAHGKAFDQDMRLWMCVLCAALFSLYQSCCNHCGPLWPHMPQLASLQWWASRPDYLRTASTGVPLYVYFTQALWHPGGKCVRGAWVAVCVWLFTLRSNGKQYAIMPSE